MLRKTIVRKTINRKIRAVGRDSRSGGIRACCTGLLLLSLVGVPQAVAAPERSVFGRVERVVDGDTLRVVGAAGNQTTLRLFAVDAPEAGQAGGDEATRFVAERVCGIELEWREVDTDRYGRQVARVFAGGADLGEQLIREGLAWRLRKYLEGQPPELRATYDAAWREARSARRGLWAGDPQPPWQWRRENRHEFGRSIDCRG